MRYSLKLTISRQAIQPTIHHHRFTAPHEIDRDIHRPLGGISSLTMDSVRPGAIQQRQPQPARAEHAIRNRCHGDAVHRPRRIPPGTAGPHEEPDGLTRAGCQLPAAHRCRVYLAWPRQHDRHARAPQGLVDYPDFVVIPCRTGHDALRRRDGAARQPRHHGRWMKSSGTVHDENRAGRGHASRQCGRDRDRDRRRPRRVVISQPLHEAAAGNAAPWQQAIEGPKAARDHLPLLHSGHFQNRHGFSSAPA